MLRTHLLEKLPVKYQLFTESFYLYHYYGDAYVGREVKIFKRFCDKSKCSIDVGANHGVMTMYMRKFSSHVYSFEPVPWLCDHLSNKFNGCNVTVKNCALGDTHRRLNLYIPSSQDRKFETRSSLVKNFRNEDIKGQKIDHIDTIEVEVRRLDEFNIKHIGFIKIDVEGFEFEVLKGARISIQENKPSMFIEIEQGYHKGTSIYAIFQYILDLGYWGYFLHENKFHSIDDFDVAMMQDPKNKNTHNYINDFLFTPYRISNTQL